MATGASFDEAAIAGLYERYGHALFRRCLTLTSSEDDARELLQEVFCQFWRRRNAFEGRASPFTYLYRIATNLSIDKLRRRRTAGDQRSLDENRRPGASSDRPDAQASAAMELAELTKGLDEETLTIAVLAHVDGLTQDEIAEAMSLSRRTVGKKLKKFLQHTRKRAAAGERTDERRAAAR